MTVAKALSDMASIQTVREKQRAFRQAALAIRGLETSLDTLADASGALPRIPHVGPSSLRIVQEVLTHGHSPTVQRALAGSGQASGAEARDGLRRHFLSRAMANHVLALTSYPECRADFQTHSTWSDGSQTLEALAAGCLARGYSHAAVTDHAGGLPIAGGLSEGRLRKQRLEIETVNRRFDGRFHLLQGVEANIDADGNIDVDPAFRSSLDLILAAPHSGLRSTKWQTDRLVTAVRQPAVRILAHPTGRKFDARAGIAANWRTVFRAAADHGVAVEIDGDPSRQDCNFELIAMAVEEGCWIALDSDAHAVDELWYTDLARAHAALGGVPPERVINFWPLDRLMTWVRGDKTRAGKTRRAGARAPALPQRS